MIKFDAMARHSTVEHVMAWRGKWTRMYRVHTLRACVHAYLRMLQMMRTYTQDIHNRRGNVTTLTQTLRPP